MALARRTSFGDGRTRRRSRGQGPVAKVRRPASGQRNEAAVNGHPRRHRWATGRAGTREPAHEPSPPCFDASCPMTMPVAWRTSRVRAKPSESSNSALFIASEVGGHAASRPESGWPAASPFAVGELAQRLLLGVTAKSGRALGRRGRQSPLDAPSDQPNTRSGSLRGTRSPSRGAVRGRRLRRSTGSPGRAWWLAPSTKLPKERTATA